MENPQNMSTQQILRTPASDLVPDPKTPFVDVNGVFDDALDYIVPGDIPVQNLLFNSKHGLGKTLLCAHLIKKLGEKLGLAVPLVTFDCSEDTREWDLIGMPTVLPDGSTAFQLGPFPLAIDLANEVGCAALLLEEISALPPGAQKVCNRMTDWRNGIYVAPVGQMFRLNSGATLIVLATMNPSAYGGVYSLNQDLRSRFGEEKLDPPTRAQMEKILKKVCPWAKPALVKQVAQLSEETQAESLEYSLSTRDMVQLLQKIQRKKGKLESPLRQVMHKFEGTEMNTVADRIDGIFATRLKSNVPGRRASHV